MKIHTFHTEFYKIVNAIQKRTNSGYHDRHHSDHLTKDMFEITDPEAFTPSAAWAVSHKSQRGMLSKQNSLKSELLKGIYKPRLTLAHSVLP